MDPNFMDMQEFINTGAEENISKQKLVTDISLFLIFTGCIVIFRKSIENVLKETFIPA